MSLQPGDSVGPYRILRRIGQGSMGVVYQARDGARNRDVALKALLPSSLPDELAYARFEREAHAAAMLRHRNIVSVTDVFDDGGEPFIVMELLAGRTLAEVLSGGAVPLDTALDIVIQLCEGLHHAHDRGIVHRDVKPANVWVLPDGGVKLVDFGIAHLDGAALTQAGGVVGTVAYMSPEQLSGGDLDGRSDVFSAGVILFEMLAGRRPFEGGTGTSVILQILNDPTPDIRVAGLELPEGVVLAVETALQKNRDDRYASAAEFGADLRLVRYRPSARPVPTDQRPSLVASSAVSDATVVMHDVQLATDVMTLPSLRRDGQDVPFDAPIRSDPAELGNSAPAATPGTVWGQAWKPALVVAAALLVVFVARSALQGGGEASQIAISSATATDADANSQRGEITPAARVRVISTPASARILVDGVDTGQLTPAELSGLGASSRVELRLEGYVQDEAVTPAMIAAGEASVTLSPAVAPPPVRAKASVRVHGDYDFGVRGTCLGSTSPPARNHVLTVEVPCELTLSAPDYFLSQSVRVTSTNREVEAPPLVMADLRTRLFEEGCAVQLNGRSLGDPPIRRQVAQGNYTVTVRCANRTLSTALQLRPERAADTQGGYYIWRLDEILVSR